MKKILLLLSALILIALTACNNDEQTEQTNTETENNQATTDTTNESETNAEEEINTLEEVVNYFSEQGFEVGEKTTKAYEMIGAVDGFGIQLNGENVEFYLYDENSDDLASIKETGQYDMDGFVLQAVANENIVLMGFEEHPEKDKIIEVFESYRN